MDTKSGNCGESCENNEKVGHLMTSSNSNSENSTGCGVNDLDKITITVAPTTGGTFEISVLKSIPIENLKKVICKKLKVPKEKILLLHKERQLRFGSLQQNSVCDGSTVTLLPSVETGLLSQRPEQTVMQALENLNDSQVNDFLSGKAPLNLTMRLGDHMMLIQLQLSAVTPNLSRKSQRTQEPSQVPTPSTSSSSTTLAPVPSTSSTSTSPIPSSSSSPPPPASSSSSTSSSSPTPNTTDISLPNLSLINSKLNSLLHKNNENLNALKRKLTNELEAAKKKVKVSPAKDCPQHAQPSTSKRTPRWKQVVQTTSHRSPEKKIKRSEIISQIMESVRRISENTQEMTEAIEGKACEVDLSPPCDVETPCAVECTCDRLKNPKTNQQTVESVGESSSNSNSGSTDSPAATLDTKALAEASRNLTQTLKKLSSEVLTCRPESTPESTSSPSFSRRRPGTPGAIIESMQHHGKGVFSGTFSGTLNPALQDRFGRPKRDISTIIHILNDLLCATPHYRSRQSSSSKSTVAQASGKVAEGPCDDESESAVENEATRGKLERLRMVMEQSRARRRARREGKPEWPVADASNDLDGPRGLDAKDAGDLMEITPPEPVVA